MELDVAKQIAKFISSNEIKHCTIMGGEFFCHPQWRKIFDIILPTVGLCRLVTNGDWGKNQSVSNFLAKYRTKILISISEDNWHSNKYTKEAKKQCVQNNLCWNVPSTEMKSDSILVPIGKLKFEPTSIYGLFGTYCSNPEKKYSFLIDETGIIYKCGFGVWDYANVKEYLDGGFAKKFKEFNKKFYKTFIPNCLRCNNAYSLR